MLLLLLACTPKPVPVAAPVAPTVPAGVSTEAIQIHMSVNFAKAVAARNAIIQAKVPDAQARLNELGAATDPTLIGEAGIPFLTALRAAAQGAAAQTTATDLGAGIGSVTATCTACHAHFNAGLSPAIASAPAAGGGHAASASWLVDALWTGVVANADTAWSSGAGALATTPKDAAGYGVAAPGPAAQAALVTLAAQATAAPLAKSSADRSAVLGKVVGACGSCHAEQPTK